MKLTKQQTNSFQEEIYTYYKFFKRHFPWRTTTNPYHILVSEIMLQQTQTKRVVPKYHNFLEKFPDFFSLAAASQYDLLAAWQGLGYNRRALALHQSAKIVVEQHKGAFPSNPTELIKLPGIGPYTSCSIVTFAYNQPTVFVETNIRVVFFHRFFRDKQLITDREIFPLVEQTLDQKNPRDWYYALMDYGASLKAQGINPIAKSKHYQKQPQFIGSDRQIRGAIIKLLIEKKEMKEEKLIANIKSTLGADSPRVKMILQQLIHEKFMQKKSEMLFISN